MKPPEKQKNYGISKKNEKKGFDLPPGMQMTSKKNKELAKKNREKRLTCHLECKWPQSQPRGCTKGQRGNRFAEHPDERFSLEPLWQ